MKLFNTFYISAAAGLAMTTAVSAQAWRVDPDRYSPPRPPLGIGEEPAQGRPVQERPWPFFGSLPVIRVEPPAPIPQATIPPATARPEPSVRQPSILEQNLQIKMHPNYQKPVTKPYNGIIPANTLVVDTDRARLSLYTGSEVHVYSIGVGKEGFKVSNKVGRIDRKAPNPDWIPPEEMKARVWRDSKGTRMLPDRVAGGDPSNPLGERALYIANTLYRIHGTDQPWTVGGSVSSGCYRMTNEDVKDLYPRVSIGAKVIILNGPNVDPEVEYTKLTANQNKPNRNPIAQSPATPRPGENWETIVRRALRP